jgi:integrase
MRIGELLGAKVCDVNLKEQKIMIYQAEKTGSGRIVYYSDDAQVALKKWLEERDPAAEFLFYGHGRRLTYGGAREIFLKYVRKAGLSHKGYTIHRLRHTFASELLNAGMRLEYLQNLLGHTSVEVTRRYARLTDKTREEEYFKAMERIERGEIDGHY